MPGTPASLVLSSRTSGGIALEKEMPPALTTRPIARMSIITQTAGPAQSWNLRTVSMPRWMISNCSAQTMTKQITSRPEWPRTCVELMKFLEAVGADQQRDDRARRRAGLRAIPETGDDGAHQRRNIGAPDAERGAGEDGIRHARLDAGIADQTHQEKDHQRADADGEDEIEEASAQKKQAGGEIIAPQAVHVRRPDVENAERAPIANRGRREIFVVERWRSVRNVHSRPPIVDFFVFVTLRLKFRHIKPRNRRPWNYPQTSISRFAYGPSATRGDDGSLLGGRRSSAGALRLSRDRAGFFRGRLHLDLVRQESPRRSRARCRHWRNLSPASSSRAQ